eukprot:GSA25T00019158001.1
MMWHKKAVMESQQGMSRDDGELATFWLRKTRKPVLCVLMVQKPGGKPVFYRGMNLEVSM